MSRPPEDRLRGPQRERPGRQPTNAVIPLVMPTLVVKSSKDIRRGLYPKWHRAKRSTSAAATPFTNALDLHNGRRVLQRDKYSMPATARITTAATTPTFTNALDLYNSRLNSQRATRRLNKSVYSERLNKSLKSKRQLSAVESALPTSSDGIDYLDQSDLSFTIDDTLSNVEPQKKKKRVNRNETELNACQSTLHQYFNISHTKSISKGAYNSNQHHELAHPMVRRSSHLNIPLRTERAESFAQDMKLVLSSHDIKDSATGIQDTASSLHTPSNHNYFGLFGAADGEYESEKSQQNYFEQLPDGVLEQIFCQVPFLDFGNLRLVCKYWNAVISNTKFMKWKKIYYSFKKKKLSLSEMGKTLHSKSITVENCFLALIRYMSDSFNRRPSPRMKAILKEDARGVYAENVVLERFPDWDEQTLNPWAIFAATVLLSETVWDVYDSFKRLIGPGSDCSVCDVLDALYCIATFLLYFRNQYGINNGLHYRAYYAIYMFENSTLSHLTTSAVKPGSSKGQQSLHSYCEVVSSNMTYEQNRILSHKVNSNQVVKIIAFAGTGKTSTLIQFARVNSHMKFLNVMYNKAVCEYAAKNFPSNVECRTAHSLAYQAVGKKYRHKLVFKLKPINVLPNITKPNSLQMHVFTFAQNVLQTIENFVASKDKNIVIEHTPKMVAHRLYAYNSTDIERLAICKEAIQLWNNMIDASKAHYKITHDVYLKLFQLDQPDFSQYDCIMIDEAQDCTEAMLDIMLSQKLPVILVGDPNQQIYGFRGASNVLQSLQSTHVYPLTKSFRFGAEIAYVASCCLETLKHYTRDTIVGNMKESFVDGTVKGQYAIISRTNEKLFHEVIRLCCTTNRHLNEPKVVYGAFAGGTAGYGLDQILDICTLKSSKNGDDLTNIKDKFIKRFKTFEELCLYAKKTDDREVQGKIDLIFRYSDIVSYIGIIKERCKYSMDMANVVFTTAHKSKGLEFDTVCLTNDFQLGNVTSRPTTDSDLSEEFNILYVALTRAKKCLVMCEKLYNSLMQSQEKFEYPVPSEVLMKDKASLTCFKCSSEFSPHRVYSMEKRKISLANGKTKKGGPMCVICASDPKYQPRIEHDIITMFLDSMTDNGHISMASLVGRLPSEPPIVYNELGAHYQPNDVMELVYILNFPL